MSVVHSSQFAWGNDITTKSVAVLSCVQGSLTRATRPMILVNITPANNICTCDAAVVAAAAT